MHSLCRSLAACVLLVVVAGVPEAGAAVVATQAQAQIRPGMSQDEVRAALGRPQGNRGGARTGRSFWRYVTTTTDTFFDVEFGSDGRVVGSQAVFVSPN